MILGEAFHRRVIQQIAGALESREKHAILLFDPSNIRYATGLNLARSDRPIAACIWSNGDLAYFIPQLEVDHLALTWVRDIRWYPEFPADEHPARWMAREAGRPLLVDSVDARTWHQIVEEAEDAELSDVVEQMRLTKASAEIDLLEQAADFADLALQRAFARLTSGAREREIRDDVIQAITQEIAHDYEATYEDAAPAVYGRIASGPRAALPGAPSSERPLARGDVVVVEFAVRIGGYHGHAGSSFFVGDPLRDIVNAVSGGMSALDTVRANLRPGVTADQVNHEGRRALERAGFGNAIRHRPGQGTGLDWYEAPWLVRDSDQELKAGMVVVNQPGLYMPGRTGVRHTETVLIEDEGPRVLNPRIRRWDDPESRLKEF
jgi:Xaa-Pro dipeptidase